MKKTRKGLAAEGATGARAEAPPAPLRCRSKVWLERQGRIALSAWRIELLEAIAELGSLSHAAERLNVPYRTAWYKLKDMENSLGIRLLESQSGGAEGGGSQLTVEARDLIARFHRASAGLAELIEERFRAEFRDLMS